jgi:hypothetical protein
MNKKSIALIASIGLAVVVSAAPASAEFTRSTYLSDWHSIQYLSSSASVSAAWNDQQLDTVTTRVTLSNVIASYMGNGTAYSSTSQQLQLQQNTILGWTSKGNTTTNTGVAHVWANPGSGSFRFQWNGAHVNQNGNDISCFADCPMLFSSNSVIISW